MRYVLWRTHSGRPGRSSHRSRSQRQIQEAIDYAGSSIVFHTGMASALMLSRSIHTHMNGAPCLAKCISHSSLKNYCHVGRPWLVVWFTSSTEVPSLTSCNGGHFAAASKVGTEFWVCYLMKPEKLQINFDDTCSVVDTHVVNNLVHGLLRQFHSVCLLFTSHFNNLNLIA